MSYRLINTLLFLAAVAGIAFALFLETHYALNPCPLCIFQRIGLIVMGVFALIAALFNVQKRLWRVVLSLGAFLGIAWSTGVAARHVWIQHLPADQVPACGPGLNYWLETFPLQSVIAKVLRGSGECAVIDWTFLGISLPQLSLAFFSVLLVACTYQLLRRA